MPHSVSHIRSRHAAPAGRRPLPAGRPLDPDRLFAAARLLAACCLLAPLLCLPRAHAQEGAARGDSGWRRPVIATVAVLGNNVTQPEIILREMTLRAGDTLDVEEIPYNISRIYSLGLFNRVDIRVPDVDSSTLIVRVDERWYFFPVPLLGIVDRDWDNWYYGLGVMHMNVRGWNEKFFAGFVLGYNPWASVTYTNPWIFGEAQMNAESGFRYQRVENKSLLSRGTGPNFFETHYVLAQSLGKRFTPFVGAAVRVAFNYTEVSDKHVGRTSSPSGIDRYLTASAGVTADTRDLREYASSGLFAAASLTKYGIGFGEVDFVLTAADLRGYLPLLPRVTLASRLFARIAAGPAVPNHEHQYFGFAERLRGHFEEETEGECIAGASAELRVMLLPPFYLHVPEVPIPEFATWKFALAAALFADAGRPWDRHDRFAWSPMPSGYGVGLHLLLPYSYVLRLDRAWDEYGRGEWILDVGAAF